MWGNIQGAIGNAIQKAKKLQSELELQLDTAVGVDESNKGDTDTEIRSQTVTPEGPVMEGWQDELDTLAIDEDFTAEKVAHIVVSEGEKEEDELNMALSASKNSNGHDVILDKGDNILEDSVLTAEETLDEISLNKHAATVSIILPVSFPDSPLENSAVVLEDLIVNVHEEQQLQAVDIKSTGLELSITDCTSQDAESVCPLKEAEILKPAGSAGGGGKSKKSKGKNKGKSINSEPQKELSQSPKLTVSELLPTQPVVLESRPSLVSNDHANDDKKPSNSCIENNIDTLLTTAVIPNIVIEEKVPDIILEKIQSNDIVDVQDSNLLEETYSEQRIKVIADCKEESSLAIDACRLLYEEKLLEMEKRYTSELASQRKSFEATLESTKLEAEAQAIADKSLIDFYALAKAEMCDNEEDRKGQEEMIARISHLEKSLIHAQNEMRTTLSSMAEKESASTARISHLEESLTHAQNEMKTILSSVAEKESASTARVSHLEESLTHAQNEMKTTRSTIAEKEAASVKLSDELSKIREIVTERERALETSASKMSEMHSQLEASQRKVLDLSAEVTEKDSKLRQSMVSAASDSDVKKQLVRVQDLMKEKQGQLAAFELEGQNLAKRHSEMEKTVRTTKGEIKKKDTEIAKLKESKEQLVKAIEEMQDLVRKNEQEASSATKSLSAMQAVSQASTDKLARLEGSIATKADEMSSQRRAMEAAWADNNESKRVVAELRADRDDLRRQIGLGTSRVMETESSRRDIEQREAVLRATNKQLQDSLQRQMQEAGVREERLRDEVGEMRKRWQEAVTNRETLSSELGSATAPLMRQISSMQDSMRTKGEAWQVIEGALSERALRAESMAETADHKRVLLEEQANDLKQQTGLLTTSLNEAQSAVQNFDGMAERLRKVEINTSERIAELESRLGLESGQKQSLQSSLRELEFRHKIDQQDTKDAFEIITQQGETQAQHLKIEIETLREELETYRSKGVGGAKRNRLTRVINQQQYNQGNSINSSSNSANRGSATDLKESARSSPILHNNDHMQNDNDDDYEKSISGRRYGSNIMPESTLPNGELSYAATERLQQQRHQKDEENKSISSQIHQLQASRDALLDEVNYLSAKNAKLEEDSASVPDLLEEQRLGRSRIELLLVLLGEKEEELEGVLGDLQDVRGMYKAQMEEMLDKVIAAQSTGSNITGLVTAT